MLMLTEPTGIRFTPPLRIWRRRRSAFYWKPVRTRITCVGVVHPCTMQLISRSTRFISLYSELLHLRNCQTPALREFCLHTGPMQNCATPAVRRHILLLSVVGITSQPNFCSNGKMPNPDSPANYSERLWFPCLRSSLTFTRSDAPLPE